MRIDKSWRAGELAAVVIVTMIANSPRGWFEHIALFAIFVGGGNNEGSFLQVVAAAARAAVAAAGAAFTAGLCGLNGRTGVTTDQPSTCELI